MLDFEQHTPKYAKGNKTPVQRDKVTLRTRLRYCWDFEIIRRAFKNNYD